MSATGELRVEVAWDGAAVCEVGCALGRPEAARVVLGQPPVEAVDRIRRLHAVCGHAQATAAALALAAADPRSDEGAGAMALTGAEAEPGRWHDGLVIEALQEHLWRLLRDWPRALGEPALDGEFARLYRALGGALKEAEPAARRAVGAQVLSFVDGDGGLRGRGLSALADGGGDFDALAAWARGPEGEGHAARLVRRALDETVDAAPLLDPDAPAPPRLGRIAAPLVTLRGEAAAAFCAQPDREGVPVETGPLPRRIGHPLVRSLLARPGAVLAARLVARLLDLRHAARRLAGLAAEGDGAEAATETLSPSPGVGLSRVDTARGVLLHRAVLDGEGRVAEYAICAPTAWNFHPRGAFALALRAVRGDDEATVRRRAGLWLTAFDPCVPFRLEVRRA